MSKSVYLKGGSRMGKKVEKKAANKGLVIIVALIMISIFVFLYFNSLEKKITTKGDNISTEQEEVNLLLELNLEKEYPKTPRDTVETFSRLLQTLYSDISDEDIRALAIKVRSLYDDELLDNNPQEKYLKKMYAELEAAREAGRTITKYLLVNEDMELIEKRGGKEYAKVYASYTVKNKSRKIETKEFILRKDQEGRWKILGWSLYVEEE